jgi:hypothetical protein
MAAGVTQFTTASHCAPALMTMSFTQFWNTGDVTSSTITLNTHDELFP